MIEQQETLAKVTETQAYRPTLYARIPTKDEYASANDQRKHIFILEVDSALLRNAKGTYHPMLMSGFLARQDRLTNTVGDKTAITLRVVVQRFFQLAANLFFREFRYVKL